MGLEDTNPSSLPRETMGAAGTPSPPACPPGGLQAAWSLLEEHGRGVGRGRAAFVSSRINSANLKREACLEAQGSVTVPAGTTSSLGPNPVSLQAQQARVQPPLCLAAAFQESHLPALFAFFFAGLVIPCLVTFLYDIETLKNWQGIRAADPS